MNLRGKISMVIGREVIDVIREGGIGVHRRQKK